VLAKPDRMTSSTSSLKNHVADTLVNYRSIDGHGSSGSSSVNGASDSRHLMTMLSDLLHLASGVQSSGSSSPGGLP
jgi:hypothetical protein